MAEIITDELRKAGNDLSASLTERLATVARKFADNSLQEMTLIRLTLAIANEASMRTLLDDNPRAIELFDQLGATLEVRRQAEEEVQETVNSLLRDELTDEDYDRAAVILKNELGGR